MNKKVKLGDLKGRLRSVELKFNEEWVKVNAVDVNPIVGSNPPQFLYFASRKPIKTLRINATDHRYADNG